MGCHFLPQGDLPAPGVKPKSLALAGRFFTTEPQTLILFAIDKVKKETKKDGLHRAPSPMDEQCDQWEGGGI